MAFTVEHFRPTDPAEAAEYDAFMRMLPALREQHPGEYVAVCGGEVIARGVFFNVVDGEAKRPAAGRAYFCGWVEPPGGYVFMSGVFEVLEEV